MKDGIHPKLVDAKITCGCGNVIYLKTTSPGYFVEVCSACHPVFNGGSNRLMLDSEGRVERFKRRYATRAGASK